ncbi:MAG: hypothetical protein AAB834_07350, partial [Patescibacteria group bacterium]
MAEVWMSAVASSMTGTTESSGAVPAWVIAALAVDAVTSTATVTALATDGSRSGASSTPTLIKVAAFTKVETFSVEVFLFGHGEPSLGWG